RSITETGKVEYQVAGPKSSAVELPGEDAQPGGPITASATPSWVHPRGEPLVWQDRQGCAHALEYGGQDWGADQRNQSDPCGGSVSLTPNGVFYMQWRDREPGVTMIRANRAETSRQAVGYTYASAPVAVPDGKGIIGIVAKAPGRMALVYAPIAVPLAD